MLRLVLGVAVSIAGGLPASASDGDYDDRMARLRDATSVTAADLSVQTRRYNGEAVRTKAKCFHADRSEFRCMTSAGTRIDFSWIAPTELQNDIERACSSLTAAGTARCEYNIRFFYEGNRVADGMTGKQFIVMPSHGEGLFSKN